MVITNHTTNHTTTHRRHPSSTSSNWRRPPSPSVPPGNHRPPDNHGPHPSSSSSSSSSNWRRSSSHEPEFSRAELHRRHSGIDANLNYVEGHTIHTDYTRYKSLSIVAKSAREAYHDAAWTMAVWPDDSPDPDRYPRGPVQTGEGGGEERWYYQEDHEVLARLAAEAARTARL
ncbi:hypothetical protein NKR19_g9767 [Coniochaeta hoffmannii]|uniref:Uncharacterized protein n=1 Tax=Coniochaeta hoffmannii TaxID=91930 RepID=A0AA38VJ53_9PEZI|nr:hypothetical protein NKR19_g9767 [Coniochaeta hoffmannii]